MLKTLVSPKFKEEMDKLKSGKKEKFPPLPDGYSYQRRSRQTIDIKHHGVRICSARYAYEVLDKIKQHQNYVAPPDGYAIKKLGHLRIMVYLNGKELQLFKTQKIAMDFIQEHIRANK